MSDSVFSKLGRSGEGAKKAQEPITATEAQKQDAGESASVPDVVPEAPAAPTTTATPPAPAVTATPPAPSNAAATARTQGVGKKTSIYPSQELLNRVAAFAKVDVDLGRGYSKADILLRLAMIGEAVLSLSQRTDVPDKAEISTFAESLIRKKA